jgi:hypothetical protein
MTDMRLSGDAILVTLIELEATADRGTPVEEAERVLDRFEAIQREATIRSMRAEVRVAEDVAKQIHDSCDKREWKVASTIAAAYGSNMGKTQHQCCWPFALRFALMAQGMAPGAIDEKQGAEFVRVLLEMRDALLRQIDVDVELKNAQMNPTPASGAV